MNFFVIIGRVRVLFYKIKMYILFSININIFYLRYLDSVIII